ncbi:RNase A-like domain-containing protein [Candidatus Uabimicrobium sp. HlEnr_7]|uniref:RNase A-like domain-containing protein n=1 Tax=Candidatus Uabimicrobium helgolandensis TaxID=3095367 RepID=UPI00355692D9
MKKLLINVYILFISISLFAQAELTTFRLDLINKSISKVDIDDHENGSKGHTIAKHCKKDNEFLIDRLSKERKIKGATSFKNKSDAQKAILQVLKKKRGDISSWLNNRKQNDSQTFQAKTSVKAYGIRRGSRERETIKNSTVHVKLVKQREKKKRICYIETAFPVFTGRAPKKLKRSDSLPILGSKKQKQKLKRSKSAIGLVTPISNPFRGGKYKKLWVFTQALRSGKGIKVNLNDHEDSKLGHTISKHCNKREKQLKALATKTNKIAGCFKNKSHAKDVILSILQSKKNDLKLWAESKSGRKILHVEKSVEGAIAELVSKRKKTYRELNNTTISVRVVIKRITIEDVELFYILSAFPEIQ